MYSNKALFTKIDTDRGLPFVLMIKTPHLQHMGLSSTSGPELRSHMLCNVAKNQTNKTRHWLLSFDPSPRLSHALSYIDPWTFKLLEPINVLSLSQSEVVFLLTCNHIISTYVISEDSEFFVNFHLTISVTIL